MWCLDKSTEYERVLGIIWEPNKDVFTFSTSSKTGFCQFLQGDKRRTKRIVVSCVMALFDPLGLLSPLMVLGKMLVWDL